MRKDWGAGERLSSSDTLKEIGERWERIEQPERDWESVRMVYVCRGLCTHIYMYTHANEQTYGSCEEEE